MPKRNINKGKPKFNKDKCLTCIYHTTVISNGYRGHMEVNGKVHSVSVACDYLCCTGHSCQINTPEGLYDMRGNDFDNCRLYKGATE